MESERPKRENFPQLNYRTAGIMTVTGLALIGTEELIGIITGTAMLSLAILHLKWIKERI